MSLAFGSSLVLAVLLSAAKSRGSRLFISWCQSWARYQWLGSIHGGGATLRKCWGVVSVLLEDMQKMSCFLTNTSDEMRLQPLSHTWRHFAIHESLNENINDDVDDGGDEIDDDVMMTTTTMVVTW